MTDGHVVRGADIEYESVDAAEGLSKGVLLGPDVTPTLSLRRFELAPGATVPEHTNEIEHEQYVLAGEYVVGIKPASETPPGDGETVEGEEYTVSAGDSVHVPAGAVHWYRNEGDEPGAFICAVPNGDDTIELR
ncbi:cupin domain-containing protein [Halosegnis rubeus]|mgnify:FL=1|jgi:quercetin dioxygenase-like cupin family protein|uniref:Cupin domain-containing protein n=1 Tax=Halosegnis rubeus TaxID=2212850 RepID=A0A5N5UA61_9EURY|nr:cupin domain-containing protein [Halosegnis rubeus]KAB7515417.1 cupin domain-containing protein [Halosegnis rubeus]KAB7516469.1 cupin domain-containing protein [Halosegnis rubeus]KAB7517542.1 cupin domain-containing protein [Halosegnis rubeus]